MPIFDQGYQHWEGKFEPHWLRWWAITWRGVRTQFRSRWTRIAVIIALSPCLALAAVLILWGLIENKVSFIQPLLALISMPEELRQKPAAYRVMIWTLSFQFFFYIQVGLMMILVAIVGPDLISKDLRFNAMPLYFARPIRRFDYFLGKLGVIGFFVGLVTVAPVVVAYLLGIAFSLDFKIVGETIHLLIGGVGAGLVMVLSAGSLMLALSSLTRNSRYVAAMWIGFWLVSGSVAGILASSLRDDTWPRVFDYTANLNRVSDQLLRTEDSWALIDKLAESIERTRDSAMRGPMMMPGMQQGPPRQVPQLGTPSAPMPQEEATDLLRKAGFSLVTQILIRSRTQEPEDQQLMVIGQNPEPGKQLPRGSTVTMLAVEAGVLKRVPLRRLEATVRRQEAGGDDDFSSTMRLLRHRHPWTWSAAVLVGLFGISVLVLSTRVKSLDRLK